MAPMRLFATQVAAKEEAANAEGTKVTCNNTDTILHKGLSFNPGIEQYQRDLLRGTFSRDPTLSGKRSGTIAFDCEMVGSGNAGVAPFWGRLMKGCGFNEAVSANNSVTYKPTTISQNSLTVGAYMDGIIKTIWGARGTVKATIEAGKPGMLHFEFQGGDFDILDGATLANAVYSSIVPPVFLNAGLLLDSYAAIISKAEIDVANTLARRESINAISGCLSVIITGRNPKGSLDPELTTVAAYDFYGKWRTPGTLGSLSLSANGTAGNIITVTCPKVRYADISDQDRNGLRTLGLDFQPCVNVSDDEISIVLT
jgi:hypothetical protein